MANGQFSGLVADIPGAVQRGLQFQQAAQLRPGQLQQQQLGTQRAEQQLVTGGLQQQQIQQGIETEEQRAKSQNLFNTVARLRALPDAQKGAFLEQNIANIESRNGDSTESRQALELFQQGKFEELNTSLDNLFQAGVSTGFLKAPKPLPKQAPFQFKEGGIIFNPNTGETRIDPAAKQRIDAIAQKAIVTGELDFKDKQSMNKDVTGLLKNTVGIFNTAKDLAKLGGLGGGPASIALVFKFMKALDPTSVVRESEFATAQNSAGIPEGIRNIFNKLQSGERLGKVQIKQFVEAAQALANTAIDGSSVEINSLLDTFGDTLPDEFKKSLLNRIPKSFEASQEPPASTASPTPGAATTTPPTATPTVDFSGQSNDQLLSF